MSHEHLEHLKDSDKKRIQREDSYLKPQKEQVAKSMRRHREKVGKSYKGLYPGWTAKYTK